MGEIAPFLHAEQGETVGLEGAQDVAQYPGESAMGNVDQGADKQQRIGAKPREIEPFKISHNDVAAGEPLCQARQRIGTVKTEDSESSVFEPQEVTAGAASHIENEGPREQSFRQRKKERGGVQIKGLSMIVVCAVCVIIDHEHRPKWSVTDWGAPVTPASPMGQEGLFTSRFGRSPLQKSTAFR